MIRKIDSKDNIVQILEFQHDISCIMNCSIGEWAQVLMRIVENEKFLILGSYENDKLVGYIVLRNNISPPVSNNVRVVFAYLEKTSDEDMKEIVNVTTNWGKSINADSITVLCKKVDRYIKYGFIETGIVSMEMKI